MWDLLQSLAGSAAALLSGVSAGAAMVAVIIVPNEAFDHMDNSRADRHVREVLKATSRAIALLMVVAAGLALVSGAFGGAVLSILVAFGFFSNGWTLAKRKRGSAPPGVRRKTKSQRVVAVAMSLMFGLAAFVAGGLSALGI